MDGLLVVDKPAGPTSHDVVARIRRATGERRVGHTGTLDPAASGVLPLVLGRATRLARFLSAADKTYEAIIHLGAETDTYDREGDAVVPAYEGQLPSRDEIDRALEVFRGTFLQQPPVYSAKKIAGRRSYELARERLRPVEKKLAGILEPVTVTVRDLELLSVDGPLVAVRLHCSSGFYVRSLAHDLGERLGTGGHLAALRRTRAGDLTLADAAPLDELERSRDAVAAALVPPGRMLPAVAAVVLSGDGVRRARHGRDVGPADFVGGAAHSGAVQCFRLLDEQGDLIALAEPAATPGLLHPAVVLV